MPLDPNPYAAPAHDGAPGLAATAHGPSLLARLWVLGLGVTAGYGGFVVLAARAFAWNPEGAPPGPLERTLNVHFNCMVFTVLTGAVMSCAVFAAFRLPARSTGLATLGLGGWTAWLLGLVNVSILPVGPWGARMMLFLMVVALGSTAASVAWAAARASGAATAQDLRLARALAGCCAALAIVYALCAMKLLRLGTLLSTSELIAVGAALSVVLFGGGGASPTQVGRIYRFAGALPSAIISLGLAALLALLSKDLRLSDTLVATAAHHASGSAVLCAVLALGHSSFNALITRGFREMPARAVAAVVSLGLVATSVSMHLLGARGMPARYASYIETMTSNQRLLTVAAFVAAAGLAMVPLVALVPPRSTRASQRLQRAR